MYQLAFHWSLGKYSYVSLACDIGLLTVALYKLYCFFAMISSSFPSHQFDKTDKNYRGGGGGGGVCGLHRLFDFK